MIKKSSFNKASESFNNMIFTEKIPKGINLSGGTGKLMKNKKKKKRK